ncbi:MAG: YHYH protein [Phycisphaerae bacterium]
MRNWTNVRTGEVVRGAFLASRGDSVRIERENGDVVSFDVAELATADQAEVERRAAEVKAINEQIVAAALQPAATKAPAKPAADRPMQTIPFDSFAPFVKTRWDDRWLYIEGDGLPHAPAAHPMMVGITAWQQQVPLPQAYSGDNAWQVPLKPELADKPVSAKEQLFRGAIAIAANGIPIFNPIKNDGRTDTFLAGELDEFGGHCGRGDDYHYHVAPLALQKVLGKDQPLAYALDGFPIYGYFDPAAKKGDDKCCPLGGVEKLDWMNGHFAAPAAGAEPGTKGVYHYHATATYPYINGGLRGKVTVKEDQIDPQPRASSPRPALPPLRGARITGFTRDDEQKKMTVTYLLGGKAHSVSYAIAADGAVRFTFTDGDGTQTTETYRGRERGGKGDRPPRDREGRQPRGDRGRDDRPPGDDRPPPREDRPPGDDRPPPRDGQQRRPRRDDPPPARPDDERPVAAPSGTLRLTSSAVANGGALPAEFSGDGEGATLPLSWTGAPEGTKSYAIIMDHTDRDGVIKTYWTLYDIPGDVTALTKNVKGVGKLGATWKRGETYVTPHSAGRGTFTYTLHLYALSAPPGLAFPGGSVTRESLLAKIKDITLGTADLRVTYKRLDSGGEEPRPRDGHDGRDGGR